MTFLPRETEQYEYLYCPGCTASDRTTLTDMVFVLSNQYADYGFFTRCRNCYLGDYRYWDANHPDRSNIVLWVDYGK